MTKNYQIDTNHHSLVQLAHMDPTTPPDSLYVWVGRVGFALLHTRIWRAGGLHGNSRSELTTLLKAALANYFWPGQLKPCKQVNPSLKSGDQTIKVW